MAKKANSKISRNLLISFLLLIVLFLSYGLYSLYGIQKMSKLTRTIYNHPLAVSNAALNSALSITKMHRNMKDVVLFDSPSIIESSIKALNEQEQRVFRQLEIVQNRILGEEGQHLPEEARQLFVDWKPIRSEVINLINKGDRKGAAEITKGIGADHVDQLEKKMIELTNYARNKASEYIKNSERIHSKAETISTLFLISGLLFSFLILFNTLKRTQMMGKILTESEERYRSVVEDQTELICRSTPDCTLTFVNSAFARYWNKTPEEMIGINFLNLIPESSRKAFLDHFASFSPQEPIKIIEHEVLTPNDEIRWQQWSNRAFFDDKGNPAVFQSVGRDVTERKQAEGALRESEERFRSVHQTAPLAFVIWDKNTHVTDWNKKAEEMFGWSKKEVVGHSFFDFLIPEKDRPRVEDIVKKLMKGELLSYSTNDNLTKKGKTITCEWNNSILHDNYGNIIGAMSLGLDITDRKQAEEEGRKVLEFAAEQSKHALIGQVAGKMAHDFNNILMGIMGNAQLAILNCDDEKIKEKLKHINEFSERGKDITHNLISFSKDQEPKQTFFKIEDKIELVLKMLEKELTGIEVNRNYKPGISELLADPGMIQDALTNILQNSIHAMSKVENPSLNLKVYSQDDKVYFEIEDNGCGIPKEHQDSIFTPSFSLKGSNDTAGAYKTGIKGTGYGMSNVKKYIVEKHKGNILLESEVGKGTKIIIALKIIKDHLSSEEKKEVAQSQIYDKRRILLVEDESAIADVQYQILTQAPFHHIVSIAVNGQMAIDVFDRNKFDIVSLDYMLPGNINGLDFYSHIRKKDKDIPVMFISGNIEFLESMNYLKEKDPNLEHLSKPINNLDYVNKINELIEKSIKAEEPVERRKDKRFVPCA